MEIRNLKCHILIMHTVALSFPEDTPITYQNFMFACLSGHPLYTLNYSHNYNLRVKYA